MNVVPFKFETKSIRTIANEQGEPWFVLRDVLEACLLYTSRCV